MANLKVLGGGPQTPVTALEVAELIDLDNRIAELRELRDALGANLMRRTAAQGMVVRAGPHRLQVKRQRDGERRAEALLVDGFPRFQAVSRER